MDALSFFPEPSEYDYIIGQLRNPTEQQVQQVEDQITLRDILDGEYEIHERARRLLAWYVGKSMPDMEPSEEN